MAVRTLADRLQERIEDFVWTSASQITQPASSIFIDGDLYSNTGSLVFDFANGTGDNGLDTGAEAANQWYALYAVPGTGGTYKLKASVSLPVEAGGSGPTGFPKYRYLGLFRNGDGASGSIPNDILKFTRSEDQFQLHEGPISNTGLRLATGAAVTTVDWVIAHGMSGNAVPVQKMHIVFAAICDTGGNNVALLTRTSSGAYASLASTQGVTGVSVGIAQAPYQTNSLGSVDRLRAAASSSDGLHVIVRGWVDPYLKSA